MSQNVFKQPVVDTAQFAMPYWPVLAPDAWQPIVEAMSNWNGKLWTTLAATNGEYLDFLNKRAKAELNLARTLSSCRTPADVWQTYSGFWAAAASDYQMEFGALAKRWTATTTDGASVIADCTKGLAEVRNRPQLAA